MTPFSLLLPGRIRFGRGEAARAPAEIAALGPRGLVVHGASASRAAWLIDALKGRARLCTLSCPAEPDLSAVLAGTEEARRFRPDWVVAIGGGAAIDFGKAIAALVPMDSPVTDHLEVVGKGLPLTATPLPFVALPTTAGTGAEATRNAVIGLPDHGRKVSLRDDRMLARLAIVDPALTDHCPRGVTLASGLDAVVQVIEPYVSNRANAFTDVLAWPAIGQGLRALSRLMQTEDAEARDAMAWVSLSGGIALSNGALGAVHGLAGPIGGVSKAAHGAVCGALLAPVLAANRQLARGNAAARLDRVCAEIATVLGCSAAEAPGALGRWIADLGLPDLASQGLARDQHAGIARAAAGSSSMKGNPVVLDETQLLAILDAASTPRGA